MCAVFHPLSRVDTRKRLQPVAQQHSWRDKPCVGHGGIAASTITAKGCRVYYAPDGSRMLWRNAKNWFVDVEGIDIQYRLIGADDDDDAVADPATAKASIDAASAAIVRQVG